MFNSAVMRKVFAISFLVLFFNNFLLAQIKDIKAFLDQCPTKDPIVVTILKDFEIRLNGTIVSDFTCSEPVSAMNAVNYSNPLIYLQTLRVIYYMDRQIPCPHLPWTDTTLYAWMKKKVNGINIKDGVSGGYCCEIIDGKKFFVTGNADAANREFDKKWIGISGNIDFCAHEVRHADGSGYSHSSCCGISGGCDSEYNEKDLGAYGIQYWLIKSWLTGFINVGARTSHSEAEINEIINWHLSAVNVSRTRFCNNIPGIIYLKDIPNPLGPGANYFKNTELLKVNLFPNPISRGDVLTINVPDKIINKIELFNTNGILVKIITNRLIGDMTISTIDLNPDVYIIKLYDNNQKLYYQKLIIQ
jgi:hypothetical protein